ncbi:unnamed protein product [Prunus armeniaca]|uniref:Uncharacterized protein n=1 Tax=Prunus armeniaca TaxID=36596 RepID=A0A6J5XJI9_PRUAR|nr:unnamed protein product [Prunus armeniaca]CAB4295453.1 unnamed protein product [Prunus armeniaca]CAB4312627.1 unnamed protein product [Prunus armeniaca]
MGSEVIHELLLSFVEAGANVLRLKGRGFLGPAFFLTQLSHINSPAMAVLCMACSQGIDAFSQSGLYSNHQDIAPRYSGVLLGLSNTAGVLAGVFGTVSTGYILQHVEVGRTSLSLVSMKGAVTKFPMVIFGEAAVVQPA